ncbi:DUF1617 family protein [Oceanobacillus sp. CFH 90083]|uniref:DUF1617 family protein n=1 Tax=Oceanobacillus sp. CFH 90083 TaxID=2592336 RepID=UPI00128B70C0|nr:DUF1617 family protein [Oceanobacillus sp. CFH 90083]
MKVEIQKGKIIGSIDFLRELELNRKQSRMRRQLISILEGKYKSYLNDREEILKEHADKDDAGEPVVKDDQYQVADQTSLLEDVNELSEEVVVIEGGDNYEMIRAMKPVLRKFEEEEYGGTKSEIYDYLCDQFKVDEEEIKNEEENE